MAKVFVAGATGKQGGATARALLALGREVHAYVRDGTSSEAKALESQGALIFQGDWDSLPSLNAAVKGCDAVFFPSMPSFTDFQAEERWTGNILQAVAESTTVKHVVYSTVSILGKFDKIQKIPGWDDNAFMGQYFRSKVAGEEAVKRWAQVDNGLTYTIIRPSGFMSNWVAPSASFQIPDLVGDGTWHTAFSSDFPMPLIDTDDIGRVVALAMEDRERWGGKEVELVAEVLSVKELIDLLQSFSGKPLRFKTYAEHEAEEVAKKNPVVKGMVLRIKTDAASEPTVNVLNLPFDLKSFKTYLEENRDLVRKTYADVTTQT